MAENKITEATSGVLLEARGLGRRDANTASWLLRGIDVRIDAGDRVAIVGPTGSGKTLLLRALARLDSVDTGQVLWRGAPVHGDAVPRFRRQVIYLHQRPALVEGNVEDNLRLPFKLSGFRQREFSRAAICALLQQVDRNAAFLDRSVRDLSGGEAQIVALLRAIQLQPTVLLLDEPTAALDEAATDLIEQTIAKWFQAAPLERAFLWVSHNRQQVDRVAHQVLTMSDGQLCTTGTRVRQEPSR